MHHRELKDFQIKFGMLRASRESIEALVNEEQLSSLLLPASK